MKYALYQNQRITPTKDIKDAICPICGELVIPKCGEIKMHHWAHKTSQNCDPWWEKETEWHRKWKDHFPEKFQEYLMFDSVTGEKHIADIRTDKGFVIEFQHSPIKPEEKEAREAFYKNMVWVVDASKYYEKFKQAIESKLLHHSKINKNYFYIKEDYYDNKINFLPKSWLESSVPVLFDFGINDMSDSDSDKQKGWLYCIFPKKYEKGSYFNITYCGLYLRKESFINKILNDSKFFSNPVLQEIEILEQETKKEQLAIEEKLRKEQEEYEKELQKQKEIKRATDNVWCNAIQNVKIALEQNNLTPLKIFIADNSKITDYNKINIYNKSKCVLLGIKSYKDTSALNECSKIELLLLIKYKEKFITTLAIIPRKLLNRLYELHAYKIGYYIMDLGIINNKYDSTKTIFFYNPNRIDLNSTDKNNLEYISKQYSK